MRHNHPIIQAAAIACVLASFTSCDEEKSEFEPSKAEYADISISLTTPMTVSSAMFGTRASGENHGVEQKDKTINNLQIFVFNSNEEIEDYRSFAGDELSEANKYTMKVMTGFKTIWVVANSHDLTGFASVKTVDDLTARYTLLSKENVLDFSMVGSNTSEVKKGSENKVAIDLTRNVSRVHVGTVKTAFESGLDSTLTDVQMYLINVYSKAVVSDQMGKAGSLVNADTLVRSDFAGYAMAGMLYEEPGNITSSGNEVDRYFYCYANPGTAAKTMLVIRAKVGGTEYFYPIVISDDGQSALLSPNSAIDISSVTIKRPGSLKPNEEVSYETLEFTITVNDWNALTARDVEF